ncbi:hypothetical protein Pla123a_38970 [Posidoniimonas polymericola]|uniref:Phage holin family protein n=1 Tax=Posidoniimonas polymericola TaxID=2528002 RepID=A0A5C5YGB4_9BACT|nr:phage holin family protein [Posidoniimonas polymericola]TWT73561.1 hypothetical protein Pla123a_38970 [Posidoniimonas polymericola]
MVSQTTLNRDPHSPAPEPELGRNSKGLTHDAIELCELQWALLSEDLKSAVRGGRTGGVLVLIAGAMLFASAPVLLLALAAWIETAFELSQSLSLLIAGAAAALAAFISLAVGWNIAARGAASLKRSRTEAQRNVAWLKQMIASKPACRN